MTDYRDPAQYWQQRLSASFDLRGVGYAALGPAFNAVLYQVRMATLSRALQATGGPLTGQRVLEIGCGTGIYTALCREQHVAAYTGVDLTEVSVSNLAGNYREFKFLRADVGAASFPVHEQFDTVLIADVLFHVVEPMHFERALQHAANCLRVDGRLIVSDVWSRSSARVAEHVCIRSRADYAEQLGRCRLQLQHVEPIFTVLQPPPLVPGTPLAWRAYARLWQHVLLRVAQQRWFDRHVPRLLSWLDAEIFLARAANTDLPNSCWLVATKH